jgi:hypothetical protein
MEVNNILLRSIIFWQLLPPILDSPCSYHPSRHHFTSFWQFLPPASIKLNLSLTCSSLASSFRPQPSTKGVSQSAAAIHHNSPNNHHNTINLAVTSYSSHQCNPNSKPAIVHHQSTMANSIHQLTCWRASK